MNEPKTRVQADIPPDQFNYFFNGVFSGCRNGKRAAVILAAFSALHKACLAEGIKPVWDPENVKRTESILARLNYNDTTELTKRVAELEQQLAGKPKRASAKSPHSPTPKPKA